MKKILVTGAAGFIGFHLAERLAKDGYEVVGIDNINDYYDVNLKYARLEESGINRSKVEDAVSHPDPYSYRDVKRSVEDFLIQSIKHTNYRFAKIDITDLSKLQDLFNQENFTYVVNLAAQAGVRYSIENPHAYVQSNLVGFVNILECCRHNKIKHLVYASSSSVYGANSKIPFSEEDRVDHPVSLYAATKKGNELMAYAYSHLYNLQTTGLRFFTVYGPWGRPDMAPMLFTNAIMKGEAIKVFNNGDMERDFTYIDDIVEGVVRTIKNDNKEISAYKVMNIGNGYPVNLMDFIKIIEKHIGKKAVKMFMPIQDGDVKRTWAEIEILTKTTGYKPNVCIDEGIHSFVSWVLGYNNRFVM